MHSHQLKKNTRRWRWGDLSLRVKGIVVVSLPLAVLLLNSACMYHLDAQQKNAEGWVVHTLQVRVSLERALSEFVRTNGVCRTYALTREDSLVSECRDGEVRLDSTLDQIQSLTSDNPSQGKRIGELRPALEESMQRLLAAGTNETAPNKMAAMQAMASERRILKVINALDAEEATLLATPLRQTQ